VPYRADMSGDPGPDRAPGAGSPGPASSHLDEDPEALEDPVHRGDATHQHDAHLREAAARAAGEGGSEGGGDAGTSRPDGHDAASGVAATGG
jgi:hypothetical protein